MLPVTLAEIEAAVAVVRAGAGDPPASFRWIERDSRQITPGDLFIALRGERFDGHDFVADAAARGAAAALVARAWAERHPGASVPLIVVDDPLVALQQVAKRRRERLGIEVVGITGSVGKTSTKEVVAAVLGERFRTYKSPGNMNSEIGLPLSLLDVEPGAEVAVLEMGGAYAFGELALLAGIAQPRIAVVTNIHPVHLERMGTIEAIAKTKAELVEAVPLDGAAVLNGDDVRARAMAPVCRGRVLTYGLGEGNDVRADRIRTEGLSGSTFRVRIDGEAYHVKIPLVGAHAVELALAALTVGHAMGMHISEMLPGFLHPGIQVRLLLLEGPRGSRLIDDTYNASAPSVLSALGLLRQMPARRRIAVLGEMRELGEASEEQHCLVGRRAAEVADVVVTFGELAKTIAAEAAEAARLEMKALTVTSYDLGQRAELVSFLIDELRAGDVVLLKGSRGLTMEEFVRALQDARAGETGTGSDA